LRYVAGQAEIVFRNLQQYFPSIKINQSTMVGILDPPRAGLSSGVIISCRKLENLRTLVYVSCDPKLALKNIVDLCRPTSKKYDGSPFKVDKITPVDMFPNTSHQEWVILLTR
jgi:tRNA (uracil-5-)-methyltransferase